MSLPHMLLKQWKYIAASTASLLILMVKKCQVPIIQAEEDRILESLN